MKLRIFSLIALAMLLFACSSEETAEIQTEQAAQIENSSETPTGPSYMPILCPVCDDDYIFPELLNAGIMYRQVLVTFDANATAEEIHCFKYKLFNCWYKDRLFEDAGNAPNVPNSEYWFIELGKPEGDLLNDICNDPLSSGSSDCD